MSIDWWMDKKDVVYINDGILFSHKKEWNLAFFNDMDGAREYKANWNKSVQEREIPNDFTHIYNLRNKTHKKRQKWDRETERQRQRQRERETNRFVIIENN